MHTFKGLKECDEPDEDRPNIDGSIETSVSDSIRGRVGLEYNLKIRTDLNQYESLLMLAEKLKYESIYLAIFAEKKLGRIKTPTP